MRRLADGTLEFTGRVDHQVKIRGNRVEPDEIRCVLESHPEVTAAAVISRRREEHSDHVLDAYLVPASTAPDGQPDDRALRDFLAQRLPTYMIPSAFHRLPELPLTSNGKTDRLALANLRDGVADATEPTVEAESPQAVPASTTPAPEPDPLLEEDPESDIRRQVAEIWARILRCDSAELGADSDFFALGGDSLATVEMLAQVSRQVVGSAAEQAFVAQVEGLIHHLTLDRVCAAVAAAGAGEH